MSTISPKREISPAELEAMPDQARFELVDGELVERKVSNLSTLVETTIIILLGVHCKATSVGVVWGGSLACRFFSDHPDMIRRPDATFVRHERLTQDYLSQGFLTIVPDLVVEVLSLHDTAYEVRVKTEAYLAAGVRLVWNVDPDSRIVEIHRFDGTVTKLHASDEINGEDVLSGFHCKVDAFFPK